MGYAFCGQFLHSTVSVLNIWLVPQLHDVFYALAVEPGGHSLQAPLIHACPAKQTQSLFLNYWFTPHLDTHVGPNFTNPNSHSHCRVWVFNF